MKKIIFAITILVSINSIIFAQIENDDLILLATAYHKFHHTYEVEDSTIFSKISNIEAIGLNEEKEFIIEIIKPENKILSEKYLKKPDSATLKTIYVIREINYNMFSKNPKPNNIIIEETKVKDTNYNELLATYYDIIFGVLVNKFDSLDLSKTNFEIDSFGLTNKKEKAIFFLVAMERFGADIWGYMNIPIPTDYKNALEIINRYPKFNGEVYYKYQNFNFKDFKLTIDIRRPKESFKDYYLDKYFEIMKYHLMCLDYKSNNNGE